MRDIYLDCSAGISGDMFLAALAGIGLNFAPFEAILHSMGLDVQIQAREECRAAGAGYCVDILAAKEQPLRHLADLVALTKKFAQKAPEIQGSGLTDSTAAEIAHKATQAFTRLAEVEAAAHGCPLEEVHFHEVGAVDTVADVLGALWGLAVLEIDQVIASPLPWFGGTVNCEHGCIPLPAPATALLMQGKPIKASSATEELVTPTGALLIDRLATSYAQGPPAAKLIGMSTGYGSRPSVSGLRLLLLEQEEQRAASHEGMQDAIVQIECHLDHLTGEELGDAIPRLLAAGAVDVLWLAGIGKKNRPTGLLRVLCHLEQEEELVRQVFHYTHTLGLRRSTVERIIIPRQTDGEVKNYRLDGKNYARPESTPQAQRAAEQGQSLAGLRLQKK